MLKFALVSGAVATLLIGSSLGQVTPVTERSKQVTLTYMGTAAWKISDGDVVILVDPYLSRIVVPYRALARRPTGEWRETGVHCSWDEVVPPDVATIDAHIQRADFVLVTHTHIDHVMNVPHSGVCGNPII